MNYSICNNMINIINVMLREKKKQVPFAYVSKQN